jgi:hypothetical protein
VDANAERRLLRSNPSRTAVFNAGAQDDLMNLSRARRHADFSILVLLSTSVADSQALAGSFVFPSRGFEVRPDESACTAA